MGRLMPRTAKASRIQLSLGSRTPCRTVRTVAVAKTRTVERDHAMSLGYQVEHPASIEILGRDHVAVEQNNRGPFPPLDVMQADTAHRDELTNRWMLAFRFPRAIDVVSRHCCKCGRSRC